MATLEALRGDITTLEVDAIVNAANEALAGGSGVNGAIRRVAGHRLAEACGALPQVRPGIRCPVGEARTTDAFDLPARLVIHAVGPIWSRDRLEHCDALLASAYRSSLDEAADHEVTSIAFPSISTGVYGFPKLRAASIAVETVRTELDKGRAPALERVVFCCFDDDDLDVYRGLLGETATS